MMESLPVARNSYSFEEEFLYKRSFLFGERDLESRMNR
jgi:hypothetical protein